MLCPVLPLMRADALPVWATVVSHANVPCAASSMDHWAGLPPAATSKLLFGTIAPTVAPLATRIAGIMTP